MPDQEKDTLESLRIEKTETTAPYRVKRKRKKVLIWIAMAVAAIILLLIFSRVFAPAPHVETTTVTRMYSSQLNGVLVASGYVVAQRKASVASKGAGRLVALNVVEGDRVKQDQVIARLENGDVTAALAQARANLEYSKASLLQARAEEQDATASFNRSRALLSGGSISQAEFDIAEARLTRARAGVRAAEAGIKAGEAAMRAAEVQLENTVIRAPFDGTVLTKNADVGEVVAPFGAAANSKGAVVTMADMSSLEVEADVSESNIEKIKPEQPCEITLDAFPEKRYRGYVHKIVPTADRAKATVMTKIRFRDLDDRVLPEMSAKVSFLSGKPDERAAEEQPKTIVAASAVVSKGGYSCVYVVVNGKLAERRITTGQRYDTNVEVLSGVTAGERIVAKPEADFSDGMRVAVDAE
jgi:RND family efflux transporter MFP subunit